MSSTRLSPADIAEAFLAACRAEIAALKPGNVHVHAGGHGMEAHQFEASAVAAAPVIADSRLGVGERIRRAVEATFAAVGCNTNLGILLLCAPLAKAAELAADDADLRPRLGAVLAGLTREDAAEVYRAIALANPGGLGSVPEQDVAAPPTVTLLETMALAAGRDRIARAYTDGFKDVFDTALPLLRAARVHAASEDLAVTTLHLGLLAAFPDTHIARKHGEAAARSVQEEAERLRPVWDPAVTPSALAKLSAFDRQLKAEGLNPGTTADFVVATLLTDSIGKRLAPPNNV